LATGSESAARWAGTLQVLDMTSWPPLWYILLSTLVSGFYGLKAIAIFQVSTDMKPWSWYVHQFWLNFIGGLSGWAALFMLALRLRVTFGESGTQLVASDFGLFFLAFVGVTGYMPRTLVGVAAAPTELLAKLVAGKSGG
jgi:hypothetical protein